MAYVYLIGSGILCIIWIIIFLMRKDLRKKLLVSSIISAPLGLTEVLFVPNYWIPKFQTIRLANHLYLGSILFCFFIGGVVATSYQFMFKEKLFKINRINLYSVLIGPLLFLTYFFHVIKVNIIYYAIVTMLITSAIEFIQIKEDHLKIVYSALFNTLIYIVLLWILWNTFPSLPASYQLQNLSGILIFGLPIEEFFWIFSFALLWTPAYEILINYFKNG